MSKCKQAGSLLLVLAMLVGCMAVFSVTASAANGVPLPSGATAYDGTPSASLTGNGSAADPFLITSTADFMYFYANAASATADDHYKMAADVYWNAQNSTTHKVSAVNFAGVLDGDGHTIYNAYGSNCSSGSISIFGTVTGTIENLCLDGAFMATKTNTRYYVAALCLTLDGGTVDSVQVTNPCLTSTAYQGGIVCSAKNGATIKNCTINGELSNGCANGGYKGYLGGILCEASAGAVTVENCTNNATITSPTGKCAVAIGGIVGYVGSRATLTIRNCKNNGTITSLHESTETTVGNIPGYGGIVGFLYIGGNLLVDSCTNNGNINSCVASGGFVGRSALNGGTAGSITITNSVNYGDVTSTGNNVGGMIGEFNNINNSITIKNSANYGDVSGASNVGGILGYNQASSNGNNTVTLENAATYGNVTASGNYAGLAVGCNALRKDTLQITTKNCVFSGDVTATSGAAAVVGCAAYISNATPLKANYTLQNTYVSANVTVAAEGKAAMIVGDAQSGLTAVTLTTTGSQFAVKVKVGTTVVETPNTYYVGSAEDATVIVGATATLAALPAAGLADGTILTALNAYATTNTLAAWVKGTNAPELALFSTAVTPDEPTGAAIKIAGANFSLGGTLAMNLLVEKAAVAGLGLADTLDTIEITDGTEVFGQHDKKTSDTYYIFPISVAAKDFHVSKTYQVRYTLKGATETVLLSSETLEYSPVQYAINMYDADATTPVEQSLNTLLLTMVQYADAAATGAKTAFETATGYNGSYVDNYDAIMAQDEDKTFTYVANASEIADIGATLSNGIALTLTMKNTAYTSVTATIENGSDTDTLTVGTGDGKFLVSGLYANDLYRTITFTFSGEGVDTVTATYSVARFLSNYEEETDSAALAKAAAIYMGAAFDYGEATRT